MAQITVAINGRSYRMACEDGEEARLTELAQKFEEHVKQLRGEFGEIGDQRLTVMAGLMVCDALTESDRKAARLQAELDQLRNARMSVDEQNAGVQAKMTEKLNDAAQRIEEISQSLTRAQQDGS